MAEKLQETGKYAMVLPRLQSVSSPVTDWHVSRKFCDTVILTASSSTFGWWLAYLSKGQKVSGVCQFRVREWEAQRTTRMGSFLPALVDPFNLPI
ncbi:hypothetical protein PMAYCL1PPCAC_33008 [Pristionchus mayeri]|uniref:Uncharacterized protein n=1 Tax=Pristionchus mayeri TaxID=1317129 RepID=A0AAN5DGG4_9BILA|nr:hypothetical protein PMAYCL1PPCAC_33008 [Pristionchus mayeri]